MWSYLQPIIIHCKAKLGFCQTEVNSGKKSACNAGDLGSIPALGRSPGEGNGYPLQYSCLENSMDRGAWWATVHVLQRVGHNQVTNTITFTLSMQSKLWYYKTFLSLGI